MVWRGWRDFLNLNNATAEAKAKRPSLPRESRDKRDHRKRQSERARTEAVGTEPVGTAPRCGTLFG